MEEGMFMIRLTGIIELAVPISKYHHEHITMWLLYFREVYVSCPHWNNHA
jgi:hypothetical protein